MKITYNLLRNIVTYCEKIKLMIVIENESQYQLHLFELDINNLPQHIENILIIF